MSGPGPADPELGDGPSTVAENEALRSIGRHARKVNLGRAARLDEALVLAGEGRLGPERRLEAEGLAHQLVGSAGTFGFAMVSELATEIEDYLAHPSGATPLGRAKTALAELRSQLEVDPYPQG